ncbi:hypothetical protein [Dasania marina]|uniref:hypothetical protein n=1 Tax=Dasania marina TaxID=471499 RepID=UPI000373A35B|nr:hypothetical protein [Dasania marina]
MNNEQYNNDDNADPRVVWGEKKSFLDVFGALVVFGPDKVTVIDTVNQEEVAQYPIHTVTELLSVNSFRLQSNEQALISRAINSLTFDRIIPYVGAWETNSFEGVNMMGLTISEAISLTFVFVNGALESWIGFEMAFEKPGSSYYVKNNQYASATVFPDKDD